MKIPFVALADCRPFGNVDLGESVNPLAHGLRRHERLSGGLACNDTKGLHSERPRVDSQRGDVGCRAHLAAHPGADDVLTQAGSQPTGDAKASVQNYFMAHPGEFLDLKRIAQPLTDLRAQCGVAVSPGQLAALVESFQ
jgi:hemophore-related protein